MSSHTTCTIVTTPTLSLIRMAQMVADGVVYYLTALLMAKENCGDNIV